jgi:hypothetical protein
MSPARVPGFGIAASVTPSQPAMIFTIAAEPFHCPGPQGPGRKALKPSTPAPVFYVGTAANLLRLKSRGN